MHIKFSPNITRQAIFSMELDATGNDVALFNTEQVSQSPGTNCVNASDCTTHRFKSTYRMSTYLVAFAVGRFEYKFKCTESGYKVKLDQRFYKYGKIAQLRFLRAQSTWLLERKNGKQLSCLPLPLPFCSIQCSCQRAGGS